jgi:hypothetical protein
LRTIQEEESQRNADWGVTSRWTGELALKRGIIQIDKERSYKY